MPHADSIVLRLDDCRSLRNSLSYTRECATLQEWIGVLRWGVTAPSSAGALHVSVMALQHNATLRPLCAALVLLAVLSCVRASIDCSTVLHYEDCKDFCNCVWCVFNTSSVPPSGRAEELRDGPSSSYCTADAAAQLPGACAQQTVDGTGAHVAKDPLCGVNATSPPLSYCYHCQYSKFDNLRVIWIVIVVFSVIGAIIFFRRFRRRQLRKERAGEQQIRADPFTSAQPASYGTRRTPGAPLPTHSHSQPIDFDDFYVSKSFYDERSALLVDPVAQT